MENKSITEIISEFTEQSKAVSKKGAEITAKAEEIRKKLENFHNDLEEQKKITAESQGNILKAAKIFTHNLENTKVKADLQEEDKNSILSLQKNLKVFNWSIYGLVGACLLSLLVVTSVGILAMKFYEKSVQSKSEVRAEIFAEMEKEGQGFYNKKDVETLQRDIKIVKEWAEKNPNTSKSLFQYRDGKLSK